MEGQGPGRHSPAEVVLAGREVNFPGQFTSQTPPEAVGKAEGDRSGRPCEGHSAGLA